MSEKDKYIGDAVALLVASYNFSIKEVQKLSLNESAKSGAQKLSRELAQFLDRPMPQID